MNKEGSPVSLEGHLVVNQQDWGDVAFLNEGLNGIKERILTLCEQARRNPSRYALYLASIAAAARQIPGSNPLNIMREALDGAGDNGPKANENITVVVRPEEQLPALPQQAETVEPAKQLPASFEEAPPAPAVEIKNGSKEQVASAKSESHQESPSTAPLEEEQIVFTEPEPSSEPSNEGLPKHLNQQIAEDLGVNYKCLEAVIVDAKRKGMLGLEKRQPMTVASLEQAAAVVREITELELLKPKDFCRGEGLEISLREFGVRLHHAKLKRWVGGYYRREDLMAVWQKWQGRSSEAPAAPPAELPGSVKGEEITVVPLEEKQIASAERQGAKAIRGDSLPENVKGVEEGLEWEEVWRVAVDFDISCEDLTAALGRSVADQNLASVKMEGTRTRAPLRLLEQLARALAQATNPLKAA